MDIQGRDDQGTSLPAFHFGPFDVTANVSGGTKGLQGELFATYGLLAIKGNLYTTDYAKSFPDALNYSGAIGLGHEWDHPFRGREVTPQDIVFCFGHGPSP